ncbi:DNA internalization-related competence protein ComEC/Rec2 [Facklamia sp. P9177]|uniref:DNA internalization-related competence protein ComEC/Rec2 n=1 Tax=Facklamia sp. P9177 TaxID=3421945 RepID=UPI003D167892
MNKLTSCRYHWTLIAMLISLFLLFLIHSTLSFFILFCLSLIRIIKCDNKAVIILAVFFLLLVFVRHRFLENKLQEQLSMLNDQEKIEATITINPNQIQQSENAFYGEVFLIIENDTTFPVTVTYWNEEALQENLPDLTLSSYRLEIEGEIKQVEPNRNFDLFNYQSYLKRKGIAWGVEVKKIKKISLNQSNLINHPLVLLANVRARLTHYIRKCGQIPLVSIHNKLLYNLNSTVYQDYKQAFMTLGILHFFSISGFHVNYLRRVLNAILLRIGISPLVSKKINFILLTFFAWLVAWPIGVIRSMSVIIINDLRKRFDWPLSSLDVLSVIYITLLIINPFNIKSLAFLLSFIMSYLIYFYQGSIVDSLSTTWQEKSELTLFCFLFSWPLLLSSTYTINFLQLAVVLLFTPIFERWILPSMFSFSILLYVSQYYPALLKFITYLSNVFQRMWEFLSLHSVIESGTILLGNGNFFLPIFLLGIAIIWFYYLKSNPKLAWQSLIIGYSIGILFYPYLDPRERIIVLDVGQGDALLYKKAFSKEAWLVDTGGKMASYQEKNKLDAQFALKNVIPALKSQGIASLEGVIITHPDIDHLGNLITLIQEIEIKHLYYSKFTKESAIWQTMANKIPNQTQHHILNPGTKVRVGGNQIEIICLDMPASLKDDFSNASSLITSFVIDDKKFLNMADLPIELEKSLLQVFSSEKVDVLKIGHHGSKTSTSEDLLDQLQPELALISSGKDNPYNHPHSETIEKLEKRHLNYLDTQDVGAIEISYLPFYGWSIRTAINKENLNIQIRNTHLLY